MSSKRAAPNTRVSRFQAAGHNFVVISTPIAAAPKLEVLSPAERKVVALLADGLSNEAIARVRRVSVRTIANQVAAIFRKLQIHSRIELIARMRDGDATN